MRQLLLGILLFVLATPAFAAGTYTDFVRINGGYIDAAVATPMASATAVEIGYANGNTIHVTGTTTITSFGAARQAGAVRSVVFDGALTLTYNSATLVLPGAEDITTAAGDVGIFVADTPTKWRCLSYLSPNAAISGDTTYLPTEMTVTGVLPSGSHIQLNHASVLIAATITPVPGQFLVVTQADAGTAGHTLTTAGTFDGTNNTATFNAQFETLVLFALTASRWVIIGNFGSVAMSSV